MKKYALTSPSLDGVLSDDHLYFEGIRKPLEVYKIRDGGQVSENNIDILEKYFNDLYNLFLRKLSNFATFGHSTDEDTMKMQALLQELIKVKKLIEGAYKVEEKSLL